MSHILSSTNISLCTTRINKNKIAPVKMDKLMNCSNHGKTFPHLALDSTCRWGSVDFRFASRKVRKASRFPCQVQGDGLCLQQAHRTSPKHPQADSDGSIDTVYQLIQDGIRLYKMIQDDTRYCQPPTRAYLVRHIHVNVELHSEAIKHRTIIWCKICKHG